MRRKLRGRPTVKELPMKQWLAEEAKRHDVSPAAIWRRLKVHPKKYYPNLKLRRVNKRVVFVQV